MEQFSTTYQNNIRNVSGANVIVQKDDSILRVDTSVSPCSILLLDIPTNIDILYNLQIVDISGNASVNNITILCGASDTINTLNVLVIENDNGGVKIRNLSSNTYIGSLNYIPPTTGGKDQKVKITDRDSTEDYLFPKLVAGNGVSFAVLNGGDYETLEISTTGVAPDLSQSLSREAAQILVNNNNLVAGKSYHITDASPTQSDGGVYVHAISDNTFETAGVGAFYNIDYQAIATQGLNYKGTWYATIIDLIGGSSYVNWNGLAYQSITGVTTAAEPQDDPTNWLLIAKSTISVGAYYVLEYDIIHYNFALDLIQYREDYRYNKVEYIPIQIHGSVGDLISSISQFCWGNNNVGANSVNQYSWFDCINFTPNLGIGGVASIVGNVVTRSSTIYGRNMCTSFYNNIIDQDTNVQIPNCIGNSVIQENTFINSNIRLDRFAGMANNNRIIDSFFNAQDADADVRIYNNYFRKGQLEANNAVKVHIFYNNLIGDVSLAILDCTNATGALTEVKIESNHIGIDCTIDASNVSGIIQINNNILNNTSKIEVTNMASPIGQRKCDSNVLTDNCNILSAGNAGNITNNILSQNSDLSVPINTGDIEYITIENNGSLTCADNQGNIGKGSDLIGGGFISDSAFTINVRNFPNSWITGFELTQNSNFTCDTQENDVKNLILKNAATLSVDTINVLISNCELIRTTIAVASFPVNQTDFSATPSSNNWACTIDLAPAANFTNSTLYLTNGWQGFGIFNLINGNTLKFQNVEGLPIGRVCHFINADAAGFLDVAAFAFPTANINTLVSSATRTTAAIEGRGGANSDNFGLQRFDLSGNPQIIYINKLL